MEPSELKVTTDVVAGNDENLSYYGVYERVFNILHLYIIFFFPDL